MAITSIWLNLNYCVIFNTGFGIEIVIAIFVTAGIREAIEEKIERLDIYVKIRYLYTVIPISMPTES